MKSKNELDATDMDMHTIDHRVELAYLPATSGGLHLWCGLYFWVSEWVYSDMSHLLHHLIVNPIG